MSQVTAVLILIFSSLVHAAAPAAKTGVKPQPHAQNTFACRGKALEQKDCLLQINNAKIQVWHDKIIFTDPVISTTENVPEQGADVVWHSLSALHLASRWFLILKFWSPPEATTGIETLRWFVFEINGGHVPLKVQKSVQKRVKSAKRGWRSDQMISHELIIKGGKVYASFGKEKILIK